MVFQQILTIRCSGVGLNMPYQCPTVQYDSSDYDASNDPDGVGLTFQQNVFQAQTCANATYNAAGQLIGTAFVARDVLSIVNALGEDGLIRYVGKFDRYTNHQA